MKGSASYVASLPSLEVASQGQGAFSERLGIQPSADSALGPSGSYKWVVLWYKLQFSHPFCCPGLSLIGHLFPTPACVVSPELILGYFCLVPLGAGLNSGSNQGRYIFFHGATGDETAVVELAFIKQLIRWSHILDSGRALSTRILPCTTHTHVLCTLHMGLLYPWCVIIIPLYNVHPYFSLKNVGKREHIIHSKIW